MYGVFMDKDAIQDLLHYISFCSIIIILNSSNPSKTNHVPRRVSGVSHPPRIAEYFCTKNINLKIIFVSTNLVITYLKCINFRLVMAIVNTSNLFLWLTPWVFCLDIYYFLFHFCHTHSSNKHSNDLRFHPHHKLNQHTVFRCFYL